MILSDNVSSSLINGKTLIHHATGVKAECNSEYGGNDLHTCRTSISSDNITDIVGSTIIINVKSSMTRFREQD
jgi:hypothetical protein